MHYYQFNIGDYAKSTRHLNLMQDLAYRRLLDMYYDTSKPLISDVKKLSRLLGMSEFQSDVEVILDDFFDLSALGYSQKRVDEELACYQQKSDKARVNGKKGGRPSKADRNPEETQSVNLANPELTVLQTKHKPITNNHKPITNNQELSLKEKDLSPKVNANLFLIDEIFQYWVRVMNKSPRTSLTSLRKSKIDSRLKDGYPSHEIKQAIDNVAKDSFLVSGGHTDIEMICRSDTNLEKYRDAMPVSKSDIKMSKRQSVIEQFANR